MPRPNPRHPRPWHRGSVFGDGHRRPLDREQRARFRFLLNMHHRFGRLTRAARDVGEALVRRLGADGRCDPTHATLASDAACDARTVRRATAALRDLGMLRWQTRLVRAGWRAEQRLPTPTSWCRRRSSRRRFCRVFAAADNLAVKPQKN